MRQRLIHDLAQQVVVGAKALLDRYNRLTVVISLACLGLLALALYLLLHGFGKRDSTPYLASCSLGPDMSAAVLLVAGSIFAVALPLAIGHAAVWEENKRRKRAPHPVSLGVSVAIALVSGSVLVAGPLGLC